MNTAAFLQTHPVFSAIEMARVLKTPRRVTEFRLRYYVRTAKIVRAARGVYAVIPPGSSRRRFAPDAFLVAAALDPNGIFSHHAALELLGASHSEFSTCTLWGPSYRRRILVGERELRFFEYPKPFARGSARLVGTRTTLRGGRTLRFTGPERTVAEAFRNPPLAGGVEELVESVSGFPALDLHLLWRIVKAYDEKLLWAAVGWLLERSGPVFGATTRFLSDLEKRRPKSPQYLVRGSRGGTFVKRWNLIVPDALGKGREPDEPRRG
jgi:predicted transcriptional regulator of viral defense system